MTTQGRPTELVERIEAAMLSYAEAAMKHGWQTACGAATGGRLSMAWERAWFERNPPASAIHEELHATIESQQRLIERYEVALRAIKRRNTVSGIHDIAEAALTPSKENGDA